MHLKKKPLALWTSMDSTTTVLSSESSKKEHRYSPLRWVRRLLNSCFRKSYLQDDNVSLLARPWSIPSNQEIHMPSTPSLPSCISVVIVNDEEYPPKPNTPNNPYKILTVPNPNKIRHISTFSGIREITGRSLSNILTLQEKRTYMNPFLSGFFCIIYGSERVPYLHVQFCDAIMHASSCPEACELQDSLAKYMMKQADRAFPEGFEQLALYLEEDNIPHHILLHHVMLFDIYPEKLKNIVWKAVSNYIHRNISCYGYSKIHWAAAERHFGHPRLLLVKPQDCFCVDDTNEWIAICNKRFHCSIFVDHNSFSERSETELIAFEELADMANEACEIGWLCFLASTGNQAAAFPIHAYFQSLNEYSGITLPQSLLYLKPQDNILFQGNVELVVNYIYDTMIEEALECETRKKDEMQTVENDFKPHMIVSKPICVLSDILKPRRLPFHSFENSSELNETAGHPQAVKISKSLKD
ncbi:hypothetical protein SJAG_03212 [Schizosaccharomyces japonicus yFS275]|uniref:Uncharacterized protein n=1 Tax=Schizosaccharomyces japonicus (strain yFS275 / FY16936) TaxID=402676 RepID=B6K3M2_SCHJY|nr:hypothetical protein SJAG_03212 [Schizosaccharomyces japonicus yFS275]EEB08079.2 hypothetical protein SJAG_03212 [Schizosaccharomyces japonicus yFS275]